MRHEIWEPRPDLEPRLVTDVSTRSPPDIPAQDQAIEDRVPKNRTLHEVVLLQNHCRQRSLPPRYTHNAEFSSILSWYAAKYTKYYEADIAELERCKESLCTEVASLEQIFHARGIEIPPRETMDDDVPALTSNMCTARQMLRNRVLWSSSVEDVQSLFDRCRMEGYHRKLDLLIENDDLKLHIDELETVLGDHDVSMVDPELHTAQIETIAERQTTVAPDQLMIDPGLRTEQIEMIPERQAVVRQDDYMIEPGPAGEQYTHVTGEQDVVTRDATATVPSRNGALDPVQNDVEMVDVDRDRADDSS